MKLVKQQRNTKVCGQCCVAMLAGISLREAIKVFGHSSATTTKEVRDALRSLGFGTADRLNPLSKNIDGSPYIPKKAQGLVKVSFPGRREWHWVVNNYGQILDPAQDVADPELKAAGRPTSHLTVWKRPDDK